MCNVTMLKNIKIDLNNKKVLLILLCIIVLVFSIIIYFVIKSTKKETPREYLIDTPYSIETSHKVTIDKEIYSDFNVPEEMNVYVIPNADLSSEISSFLTAIGKGSLKKTSVDNSLYIWSGEGDYVEYIPNTQSLFFRFTKPANTRMVTVDGVVGKGYLATLFKEYLGYDYSFIKENISNSGYLKKIEANRSIDGYPLFLDKYQSYSDVVSVDSAGKLYEGTLTLVKLDDKDIDNVSIVTIEYLQAALNYTQYPKTIYYGFYPTKPSTISTEKPKDGVDMVALIDQIKLDEKSIANKIELGYLYRDSSYTQLVPTYRIQTEGSALLEKKTIKLPIIILTNAIDPGRVYYPSN